MSAVGELMCGELYAAEEARAKSCRGDAAEPGEPKEDTLPTEPCRTGRVVEAFAAFDGAEELVEPEDGGFVGRRAGRTEDERWGSDMDAKVVSGHGAGFVGSWN